MTDAEATLVFSIIAALTRNAHKTGVTAESADALAEDIISEMFSSSTRWAVEQFLREKE